MCLRSVVVLLAVSAVTWASTDQGELLASVIADCSDVVCLKKELLGYLGGPKGLPSRELDSALLNRVSRIARENELHVQLPEAALNADLVFRPGRGLDFDVELPLEKQGRSIDEGRDLMKKKMLLPVLMLLKLKMKLLTPILLTVVGLKAMKALVLSKIAILLVVGFLIVQLCQKLGMAKMSMMPASMMPSTPTMDPPTPMPPMYGPPTTTGYEPPPSAWEPSGPYSRVYDVGSSSSSQQLAYSAYSPSSSSSSSKH